MGTHHADGGYSATVEIYFEVNGARIGVAKTGGGRMYMRDSGNIPLGTKGRIVVVVDGQESASEVVVIGKVDGVTHYEVIPEVNDEPSH